MRLPWLPKKRLYIELKLWDKDGQLIKRVFSTKRGIIFYYLATKIWQSGYLRVRYADIRDYSDAHFTNFKDARWHLATLTEHNLINWLTEKEDSK